METLWFRLGSRSPSMFLSVSSRRILQHSHIMPSGAHCLFGPVRHGVLSAVDTCTTLFTESLHMVSRGNAQSTSRFNLSTTHGRSDVTTIPRTAATMHEPLVAAHASPQRLRNSVSGIIHSLRPSSRYTKSHSTTSRSLATQRNIWPTRQRIPKDAWDSHMHVIEEGFALAPDAVYKPSKHTVHDALEFESSVGIQNIVLVQPSIYGNDNACLLDALDRLGTKRARGVVAFDPETTSQSQLQEWHSRGVRGVRLNISSVGREMGFHEIETLLRRYADAVRPLNWVVQVYIPMALIEPLEKIVPSLNVRFCIDHLGHPSLEGTGSSDPYGLPGFSSLVRLVQGGHAFVKLSAPYRLSSSESLGDVEPVATEIIRVGGKSRVVFATDWPHTRFEGLDIRPWMDQVIAWCGDDEALIDRLFRGNAEDLWSVTRT